MEYLIGAGVGVGVSLFGALTRFDRERVFYPVVLVVVAAYYLLFAAMAGSGEALWAEAAGAAAFTALAVGGFRQSLWIAVAGLIGHGAFDLVHALIIENPGVPAWWPGFCAAADLGLGACLALRLSRFWPGARLAASPR